MTTSNFNLLFNFISCQVYKNALGHIYVAEVMNRQGENTTEQVEKIFLGVKTALERILKETTWMDAETRDRWKIFNLANNIDDMSFASKKLDFTIVVTMLMLINQ